MGTIELIAVGASAGGVETYQRLVRLFPRDFTPCVVAVQHFPEGFPSQMPTLLSSKGALPVGYPADGEALRPGHVYLAPPGLHLLVKGGRARLVRGPKENLSRPAIDPLFRTAADCYGPRMAAVLLSGLLDDGTLGLEHVLTKGGLGIVQDPEEAAYKDMPLNAIKRVAVRHIMPLAKIVALLAEEANLHPKLAECVEQQGKDPTEMGLAELSDLESQGNLVPLTCPECNGSLTELNVSHLRYYRCRVGHSFSQLAFLSEQTKNVEATLWSALRALEETVNTLEQLNGKGSNESPFDDSKALARQIARQRVRMKLVEEAIHLPESPDE